MQCASLKVSDCDRMICPGITWQLLGYIRSRSLCFLDPNVFVVAPTKHVVLSVSQKFQQTAPQSVLTMTVFDVASGSPCWVSRMKGRRHLFPFDDWNSVGEVHPRRHLTREFEGLAVG
jgi:hypothetical protein